MRLEGSLDAFSLPDIFQLLSFTKKTGALHLRREQLHGVVYVTTGSLTGGDADIRRQGLARRLVGIGAVTDDALSEAVEAVRNDRDLGVARALQAAGAVDEALLHEAAAEHVTDAVFDLMRWPDGDFAFVVDEANPDEVGISVSVEDAVAEARRRLDAWTQVSTTVPSPDSVLAVALTPPEDPALSRDDWALLALVDGRRPVFDVVAATGRGEFAVVSVLASLVERGLLVVTSDGQPPEVASLLSRLSTLSELEAGNGPGPIPEPSPPDPSTDVFATDELDLSPPAQREPDEADLTTPDIVDSVETDDPVESAADPIPMLDPEETDEFTAQAEPFPARRRGDQAEDDFVLGSAMSTASMTAMVGQVEGTAAMAPDLVADPGVIERDPSVNKSLLLRLIAGVRGL